MAVSLPKDPTGEEFEDLIGAVLRSRGYFTETRLVLKGDSREVLELDVVATPAGPSFLGPILVEAKRGAYSFANLFKLYGQRTYLGIPSARLVHWTDVDQAHKADFARIGEETGVHCCTLRLDAEGNYDPTELAPATIDLSEPLRNAVAAHAWYELIAARLAFAAFSDELKANPSVRELKLARQYDLAIRRAFFEADAIDRVSALYAAWSNAPRITGELVAWHAARSAVEERTIWNRINDTHELPWLQYVMLVEHRARLGIVKNALQHALEHDDERSWSLVGLLATPASFREGMLALRQYEYREMVPFALQLFLESFGGFLFEEDSDKNLFAECAGIPPDEVDTVLGFVDRFFPVPASSWFYSIKDRIRAMKIVPGMLRGAGALLRYHVLGLSEYAEQYPDFGWLLGKWHNALYFVLEDELAT